MKIGLVASCFDMLHAGHCLMLKDASSQCDHLIAAVQTDPTTDRPEKNKPVQSLPERMIQIESIRWVDEVVTYGTEEELLEWLIVLKPDVRILGSDYNNKDFTGSHLDTEIYFHERNHNWSTSALRKKIVNES